MSGGDVGPDQTFRAGATAIFAGLVGLRAGPNFTSHEVKTSCAAHMGPGWAQGGAPGVPRVLGGSTTFLGRDRESGGLGGTRTGAGHTSVLGPRTCVLGKCRQGGVQAGHRAPKPSPCRDGVLRGPFGPGRGWGPYVWAKVGLFLGVGKSCFQGQHGPLSRYIHCPKTSPDMHGGCFW
jgi:hypothetical protein